MAAHIIQDLPFALHETSWKSGLETERIEDFHLVNEILGAEIGNIQDEIIIRYNGFLRWLDRFGKDDDEILTNYGIRVSRGMAWYNAIRLLSNWPGVSESLSRSVRDVINR